MEKGRLTWEEIVKRYPDKWVGLTNVEWKNSANVKSAVVIGADDKDIFWKRAFSGEDIHSVYTTPDNLCPLGIFQFTVS